MPEAVITVVWTHTTTAPVKWVYVLRKSSVPVAHCLKQITNHITNDDGYD